MLKRFSYYFCLMKKGPDSYLWLTDSDPNPSLEPLNTYDLGLPDLDPDPLARGLDQDLNQDPSIISKIDSFCFMTSFLLLIFEKVKLFVLFMNPDL